MIPSACRCAGTHDQRRAFHGAARHLGLHGPFTVFTFEGDPTVVYLEHHEAAAYLEEPEVTREYLRMFDRLRTDALSRQASAELIDSIAEG